MPAIGDGLNEVHDRVDEAPAKIAPQSGGEHRVDFLAPGRCHGYRADEGERHEQAKEHFGNPIHGAENRRAGLSLHAVLIAHAVS